MEEVGIINNLNKKNRKSKTNTKKQKYSNPLYNKYNHRTLYCRSTHNEQTNNIYTKDIAKNKGKNKESEQILGITWDVNKRIHFILYCWIHLNAK